jgi:hypothetical protein
MTKAPILQTALSEAQQEQASFRIKALSPASVTLAQQGAAVYRGEFDLFYHSFATHPNAMWQADHTSRDILLLDEAGLPARPWSTVIKDDYSRAITSYRVLATLHICSKKRTSMMALSVPYFRHLYD